MKRDEMQFFREIVITTWQDSVGTQSMRIYHQPSKKEVMVAHPYLAAQRKEAEQRLFKMVKGQLI